ncbi:putative ankyrin repeat protein [Diaporthe ampelina]|uniref:Putative ankyrin repeat protein n=1 Tax=Diaporthe ampelina TaxID=1214573 RepID=A0A0G2FKB9_9PEZI|nr:putative ankyrin repeat protein [Diaporthe ampelina]
MREHGVDDYKVPMGVKWHTPVFVPRNYDNVGDLTVEDFVTNPGKMSWIMNPIHKNVRRGNPVLPLLHPRANYSDKDPELVWEDEFNQNIPDDCLTDWYYDEQDKLIEPGSGHRCRFFHNWGGHEIEGCRDKWKPIGARAADGPGADYPTPSLQERHARTLVNDQNSRGGSGTKELCEDPHSVGPSYANHQERVFCRMTDKTLWPFCDSTAGVSRDCFDAEAEVLVENSRPVGKRTLYWDAIEDWHSGERVKRAA